MKKLFFKPLRLSAILILLILSFHGCSTGDGSSPGDIFNLTLEKLVRVFRSIRDCEQGSICFGQFTFEMNSRSGCRYVFIAEASSAFGQRSKYKFKSLYAFEKQSNI